MSQINVNLVAPYQFGTVSVNGAQIHANVSNKSLKINNDTNQVLGLNNVVIGMQAGQQLTSGSNGNTIIGMQSGPNMTSGVNNTLVGNTTGNFITTGYSNTCIGKQAGALTTTGYYNTSIGDSAGDQTTTGQNNVALGAFSNQATGATSNSITLGNVSHNVLRCAVTAITSLSDARDKKDVAPIELGLDFVKELNPVKFVWDDRNEEGKHDIADSGFIAQDLKALEDKYDAAEVLKLVYDENPEKLEASYGRLIPVLVQAIKDLAAKVETLGNK
jgi:hypothetical protein